MQRYHRHLPYSQEQTRQNRALLRPVVAFVVVIVILYYIGSWLIGLFGGTVERAAAALSLEERGVVQVSLEGEEWKRATENLKLYPGDKVSTSSSTNASLTLFDGTVVRLDENSAVAIEESKRGDDAEYALHLEKGSLWIAVPTARAFSGSIVRTLTSPILQVEVASQTDAVFKERSISIFDGDGPGATVTVTGHSETVVVGEGQTFTLPDGPVNAADNLYSFRTALNPQAVLSPFIEESRRRFGSTAVTGSGSSVIATGSGSVPNLNTPLTVDTPTDNATITTPTVKVEGHVTSAVRTVQVNGYATTINPSTGQFSVELAMPDKDEVQIRIEAQSSDGELIAEALRTVLRDRKPPSAPSFTQPAKTGDRYQTQRTRFEIIGEAPADAVGIIVNDYRLQFFNPGDKTWSYLADTNLNNLREGENVFTAVAINQAGVKSDPVKLTIIVGGETEGVVGTSSGSTAGTTPEPEQPDPSTLPNNAPLKPGTLKVNLPTAGTTHTATGSELLIEGSAPAGSASIWVNDYKLRLYEAGKPGWNYIASVELGTMKKGSNTYTITARDAEQKIIDKMTYTIQY